MMDFYLPKTFKYCAISVKVITLHRIEYNFCFKVDILISLNAYSYASRVLFIYSRSKLIIIIHENVNQIKLPLFLLHPKEKTDG